MAPFASQLPMQQPLLSSLRSPTSPHKVTQAQSMSANGKKRSIQTQVVIEVVFAN